MEQIKLRVPDSWADITVKQYQEFMKMLDTKKNENKKTMDMICLFCDITKEQLKQVALKDLDKIGSVLLGMTKKDPSNMKLKKHVKIDNNIYSIIPDMSNMTTGEFVDLENYTENAVDNLHNIMSILYRKRKGKIDRWGRYNVEDYEPTIEKKEKMLKLPMDIAFGCLNFFFHLENKLLTDSVNYLEMSK